MSRFAPYLAAVLAVGFASVAGYFAATALGVGQQAPQITTTVDVGGQGPTGPAGPTGPRGQLGPTGPAGPGGAEACPAGSTFGKLILNGPKGQTAILTCIVN